MPNNIEILNNAIFDNIDHMLIATDTNGIIQKFNKAAEDFLGYRADEVVDVTSPAIFHLVSEVVQRAEDFSKELNRTLEPGFEVFVAKTDLGLPNEHEWTYISKKGVHKPVLLSVTALLDENHTITGYIGVAKDISESKRITEDLNISKNRLKEAQRIAKIGSWSLDIKKDTLFWSEQIYSIFEIDPLQFEPTYEGFLNTIHPEDVEHVNAVFNNSLKEKKPYTVEHRLQMKDGSIKYVLERGETLYSSTGEAFLTQGTVQDITELKKTQQSLIEAKDKAENANKAKSRFLANMSHEIRTPLNGIMGFIDLLKKEETDLKKSNYLEIIQNSSTSLLNVINDILDLSKIEDDNLHIEAIDFNLEQDLNELFSFYKSIADAKNISLNFSYPKELSSHVHTDPLRLKQVLSNLITNAIKFSKEGFSIRIIIHRDGNNLHMAVSDQGIGISEEAIERIFKPFEQADTSTTRQYGGTGLGLSISKKLTELLQGELSVKSKLGEGSTFSFFVNAPEVTPREEVANYENKHKLSGHILVAEDNKTNQLLISILLEEIGLSFKIVEDGEQAIEAIKTNPKYELILMDINMPNMNGIEATLSIRDPKNKYHDIPVIALTANAIKEDVAHYLKSGFNDHVPKPIDSNRLHEVLSNYLMTSK